MVLKLERFWVVTGMAFVLLVIYLSLTPDPLKTATPFGIKLGHIFAYGWLMLWFAQLHRSLSTRLRIAAAFCVMGIMLEYLQGLTGYRTFAYADMGYNAIGLALGLLLSLTPMQDLLLTLKRILRS